MSQIPEYLVDAAVEKYGQNFMFVTPEREVTEEDRLGGWAPSGKKTGNWVGTCTRCGQQSLCNAPEDENRQYQNPGIYYARHHTQCPHCWTELRIKKGWYGKKTLADKFYLQAWEVESFNRVILWEAIVIQKDWNRWQETNGAAERYVYDQRHTILTPGKSETIRWNGTPLRTAKTCGLYEQLGRNTNPWGLPLSVDWEAPRSVYAFISSLNNSFLAPLFRYLAQRETPPEEIAPWIFRMNEEPIVEFALKAGFEELAKERVEKTSPAHGSRHINFAAKSPKKMFRGLSKNNALQKMKELLNIVPPQYVTTGSLELAARRFMTTNEKPDEVAPIVMCGNELPVFSRIWELLPRFPSRRILAYMKEKDCKAYYYRDYLEAAASVGAPLDEARTAFPADLTEAHDEMTRRKKFMFSEKTAEKCRKRHDLLVRAGYEYHRHGIQVIVPETPGEIKGEGMNLDHCVGNYAERHCDGSTTIVFIRHTNSPKSWFTLEIDPKTRKFLQCYGYKNRTTGIFGLYTDYDPEVGKFLYHYSRHLAWAAKHKREIAKRIKEDKKCRKTA